MDIQELSNVSPKFRELHREVGELERKYDLARNRVEELRRELSNAETTFAETSANLDAARRERDQMLSDFGIKT